MKGRKSLVRIALLCSMLLASARDVIGQGYGSTEDHSDLLLYSICIVVALVFLCALVLVANNYVRTEAGRQNVKIED